jgi:hypothetical protein
MTTKNNSLNLDNDEGIRIVLEDVISKLKDKPEFTANDANAIVNALRLCKVLNDSSKTVNTNSTISYKISL